MPSQSTTKLKDKRELPVTSTRNKHRRRQHHFLAAWMRSPKKIGALLPSSRRLARAMVAEVNPDIEGSVIELGAGTGVMTNALLHAISPERLIIIERDKYLHGLLTKHFKGITILNEDALNLQTALAPYHVTKACAIISSLPFLSIPRAIGEVIQEQMATLIGEEGVIVQFTYGRRSPISYEQQKKLGLIGKRIKTVVVNMPPAHIWVYRRGSSE